LQELCLFHYVQIIGGNKYREGYLYKITNFDDDKELNNSIETALKATIEIIEAEHSKTVSQNQVSKPQSAEKQDKNSKTTQESEIVKSEKL
jgi:hypothetical protein